MMEADLEVEAGEDQEGMQEVDANGTNGAILPPAIPAATRATTNRNRGHLSCYSEHITITHRGRHVT